MLLGPTNKRDLNRGLEAHFATLRSSSLKNAMKSWQAYAAVTGSALALATGASADMIHASGNDAAPTTPAASARPANLNPVSARIPQLMNAMKLAAASPRTTQA